MELTPEIAITLLVVLGAVAALLVSHAGTDIILSGALGILLLVDALYDPARVNIVSIENALRGFSNSGMITVAVMFIVAEGLQQTGAVGFWVQQFLGQPRSRAGAQLRFMVPTAVMSALLNNTPVVAILMAVLNEWAKKTRQSVSHLLMPLSYAAILGGMCTLIGTSTTLVVNGMLLDEQRRTAEAPVTPAARRAAVDSGTSGSTVDSSPGVRGLTMFELAWVGLPCCLAGLGYIVVTSRWLLPDRRPVSDHFDNPREYTVEMMVDPGSPLVGRTIEGAGLRHLPGMYLMEIDRRGHILPAVAPSDVLQAEDRLVFVGVIESVVDLQRIPGLKPATDQVFKLDSPRSERCLIEAVVSNTCPIINTTIREAQFRTRYNAVVIAVARNGQRLGGKIGDIVLLAGDTLLLEAHPTFADLQRNSRDFYLVSRVENSTPRRHERAWMALLILLGMVMAAFSVGMLLAALAAAGLMLLTRCVRGVEARQSIEWHVLVTIAAGLGLGEAMKSSGAARYVAASLIHTAGDDPVLALTIIYGVTMLLTNLITAKAAAGVILFLALETAASLGVAPMPFAIAVIIASAASFATPMGYQTNMMVFGPGGYRYLDYVRFGGPLSLILWAISIAIIPVVWPF